MSDVIDSCRKQFVQYFGERGWDMREQKNHSGYVEFTSSETMKLWQGWYAARTYYAGRDEMCF